MDIPLWLKIVLQLLFQAFLIFLNAVFACAEIAVIEVKGAKLDKLCDDGNKKAKKLRRLADNPSRFLATIQVAITLAGFLGSAFAAESFSTYIIDGLKKGVPTLFPRWEGLIDTVSVILITLILSYFTLIFGELVPKRLAMNKPEKIALGITGLVRFISVAFKPLVSLLSVSTNGVLRILGVNPNEAEGEASEDEIRMMADASSEAGVIDEEENQMIQNVFEFNDKTVGEIATHRTELTVLHEEDSDEEWENIILSQYHTYYPVCGESIDSVTGILSAEKYLRLKNRTRENVLAKAVSKPKFVADVMKADVLFKDMKKDRSRIAIVVDEYGGTYGVISMNDLIEQIVGELDETENVGEIVKSNEGYIISGGADREDVTELFDIDSDSDSATIGGWVMEKLEKIPEVGDEVEAEGIKVKVTKADDKRVLEVYAEKLPEPEDDDDGEEDKDE